MNNLKGYLIIGLSIIIASVIIYLSNITNLTSLDHCYSKVYKSKVMLNKKYKAYDTREENESNAAIEARYVCLNP